MYCQVVNKVKCILRQTIIPTEIILFYIFYIYNFKKLKLFFIHILSFIYLFVIKYTDFPFFIHNMSKQYK